MTADARPAGLTAPPPALAFHAAPPDGTWINDPNGLVRAGGQWRLFAQHRADPPDFRATGWARFSSPDLLRWTFDGPVMPPDGAWNYSGCVLPTPGGLEAMHTLHDGGLERQARRISTDHGTTWSAPEPLPSLGQPARNRRDPFLCIHGGAWHALLAEPCDWTDWDGAPPSALRLYHSHDRRTFEACGRIGPWSPPGVMWEVPLLLFIGGRAVLVLSVVDRRDGGAATSVRAWAGRFDGGFVRDDEADADGALVDFGPDFYAMMTAVGHAPPLAVGWLSSWATARRMPWPGFSGGPISLPRELALVGARLGQRAPRRIVERFREPASGPLIAGMASATIHGDADIMLDVEGECTSLTVVARPRAGTLTVRRRGADGLDWERVHALAFTPAAGRTLRLFVDGPAVELFLDEDAIAVSAAIAPMARPPAVRLRASGVDAPLAWFRPA